jgi:hypothetical protein
MFREKGLYDRMVGIEKELVLLRGEIERQQGMLAIYRDVVEGQAKHIDKLLDRAMARELKEYKTFTLPEGPHMGIGVREIYNPMADEELAGRVVVEEELGGKSER